ncbi:radical SAM/SPASM domain-containing protein [Acetivibrio mesophilus]|uniref:Radical SAM protein n=1 Tax=Acetivibrio mesophilus TaxID=2487273 RepID=A0A4V1K1T3_9FIRM|nr:radical SAM protein [Acetivibrio mesophilus]RXE57889.1 radical SAM protein [Acetivibrio mesophilus]HHV30080.1 radical SAM protein [Clostridium sp.]
MCNCLVDSKTGQPNFFLQWHITAKCDQKCKHCYMYDSPFYQSEKDNELTLADCKAIIDDFSDTASPGNRSIYFTGGDPLLRNDFFEILEYTADKNIYPLGIAGNSYHLDLETALQLKRYGVDMYQISLDGLKEIHDYFRKPGSFDDTLRAYEVLNKAGIRSMCMFTLSRKNMNQLIEIIRLAAQIGLDGFDFDRVVPVGAAKDMKEEIIDPLEYKELLVEVNNEYKRLRAKGCRTQFGYKDNLWGLVLDKETLASTQTLVPEGYSLKRGCLIGKAGLSVLSDGSVMACRRLPVVIGKLPQQRIRQVFYESSILKELKRTDKLSKCSSCTHLENCRGCRAIAYAYYGNCFADDPGCWL